MVTLSIKDENFSGKVLNEVLIGFRCEIVTIQDIIETRVKKEVENYNNKLPEYYNGLIEPTDAEKTLNGYKLHNRKPIDAEKQVYVALDAFQKNGFFVLVDNEQCTTLEQSIRLTSNTSISFVKLTPLVGG
jgi:adenylosuccinate synthase